MIKIIALLCRLANPDDCHEQIVTTSQLADISMRSCAVGQPQLAAFMAEKPQYFLKLWRCEEGNVPKKERT